LLWTHAGSLILLWTLEEAWGQKVHSRVQCSLLVSQAIQWKYLFRSGGHLKRHDFMSITFLEGALARVIFLHGDNLSKNIAVEVPLWDTRIMSSSQPIMYYKHLMLILVSWLEGKWCPSGCMTFKEKTRHCSL